MVPAKSVLSWLLVFSMVAQCSIPRAWADVDAADPQPTMDDPDKLLRRVKKVEDYMDRYGTIVPKQPDIWGEARLSQHRQEFEEILAGRMTTFGETIQASLDRTDQSYLAMALTLQAAVSGQPAIYEPAEAPEAPTVAELVDLTKSLKDLIAALQSGQAIPKADGDTGTDAGTGTDASTTDEESDDSDRIELPDVPTPKELLTAVDTVIKRTDPAAGKKVSSLTLEPTLLADQHGRFLYHLQELRRINEGDDTADSPGYALHLVRIPVSVDPGTKTRTGYGAEVSFTLEPVIDDSLLANTFRDLVINDLVDLLFVPVLDLAKGDKYKELLSPREARTEADIQETSEDLNQTWAQLESHREILSDLLRQEANVVVEGYKDDPANAGAIALVHDTTEQLIRSLRTDDSLDSGRIARELDRIKTEGARDDTGAAAESRAVDEFAMRIEDFVDEVPDLIAAINDSLNQAQKQQSALKRLITMQTSDVDEPARAEQRNRVDPASNPEQELGDFSLGRRRARSALAGEQVISVLGLDTLRATAQGLSLTAGSRLEWTTARSFLQRHLEAAYDSMVCNQAWWNNFGDTSELVQAIRDNDATLIYKWRNNVEGIVLEAPGTDLSLRRIQKLIWPIVVESVLLDARLKDDMRGVLRKEIEDAKFYLANPDEHSRNLFKEYVRTRWPVHVFHVDPMTTDQNVADRFVQQRELQLALAAAFASGNIQAKTLINFSRRLETEMQTIGLNRTVVGFAHGDDVFGWRFYPRVQTPPRASTAMAMYETLYQGERTPEFYDAKRKLEPGIRECVALVIAPSFIPKFHVHSSSTWFPLSKRTFPQNIVKHDFIRQPRPSLSATRRIAKDLDTLIDLGNLDGIGCGPNWLEANHITAWPDNKGKIQGRVERQLYHDLFVRTTALENALPFRSFDIVAPFESTMGGFEMFTTGVTDLSPELYGVETDTGLYVNKETTILLVGENFSVRGTKVIAGGVEGKDLELISRGIAKVTIPAGAIWNSDASPKVEVVVATPYGVTQPVLVEAVEGGATQKKSLDALTWLADSESDSGAITFADGKTTAGAIVLKLKGVRNEVNKEQQLLKTKASITLKGMEGSDQRINTATSAIELSFDKKGEAMFSAAENARAAGDLLKALKDYIETHHTQNGRTKYVAIGLSIERGTSGVTLTAKEPHRVNLPK